MKSYFLLHHRLKQRIMNNRISTLLHLLEAVVNIMDTCISLRIPSKPILSVYVIIDRLTPDAFKNPELFKNTSEYRVMVDAVEEFNKNKDYDYLENDLKALNVALAILLSTLNTLLEDGYFSMLKKQLLSCKNYVEEFTNTIESLTTVAGNKAPTNFIKPL